MTSLHLTRGREPEHQLAPLPAALRRPLERWASREEETLSHQLRELGAHGSCFGSDLGRRTQAHGRRSIGSPLLPVVPLTTWHASGMRHS